MTLFERAQRFVGEVHEVPGDQDHPLIQWWLSLCGFGFDVHDEVSWCSAFINGCAWDLRLPRSKSAMARSWLGVGVPTTLDQATSDNCIVILKRGPSPQPGPEISNAPGHVGLFAGREGSVVLVLGGNQGNQVSIARFNVADVLGVRRIA